MSYRYPIIWVVLVIAVLAGCSSESAPTEAAQQSTVAENSEVNTSPDSQPTAAGDEANNGDVVARVNGVPITSAEYQAELERRLQNSAAADPSTVASLVMGALIEQELMEQAAPTLGVSVTEEDVQAEINALRQEMSDEQWQQALALNGYENEADFAAAQRDAILAQRVRDAILAPLSGNVPQVHARHIVVQTEQEANNILTRLESGESFESIAQTESIDVTTKDRGGDLGWFTAEELMDNRLADVAFGLEPGQIAGPIATRIGYHIIQLIERAEREVEQERLPLLMENIFINWLDGQYRAATIERY